MSSPNKDDEDSEHELARYKSSISVAKRNHTRVANLLIKNLSSPEVSSDSKCFLEKEYCRCKDLLAILTELYTDFLTFKDEEDDGSIDKNNDLQDDLERMYWTTVSKWKPISQEANKSDSHTDISAKPNIRVPDMKSFNNTIRGYAKFMHDFRTHYEKFYGVHASLVLKNNLLSGYSQDVCASAETVDEVFHELDKIYGDSGKLVEAVMSDIDKVRPCSEGKLQDIRLLHNTLQLAVVDLKGVSLETHVKQYQTVVQVVRKLSPLVQRRWAERLAQNNVTTDKRFDELMIFLDLEIRTLELMPTNPVPANPVSSITSSSTTNAVAPATVKTKVARNPNNNNNNRSNQASGSNPSNSANNQDQSDPKCPLHPTMNGHYFNQCRAFRKMSTDDIVDMMKNAAKNHCRSCLRISHPNECTVKPTCQKEGCTRPHFTFMHDACNRLRPANASRHSHRIDAPSSQSHSISPAQMLKTIHRDGTTGSMNTLWDTGSNVTLVQKDANQKFNFEPFDDKLTTLSVEGVGGKVVDCSASRFKIPLLDHNDNLVCSVIAYEIQEIGTLDAVDVSDAAKIFALTEDESKRIVYPRGEIQLLVGTDNAHIVHHHLSEIDGMRLSESILGKVIWGTHPSFSHGNQKSCRKITAKITTPPTLSKKKKDGHFRKSHSELALMNNNVKSLFSTEAMGVSCNPRCGRCGCGKCSFDDSGLSLTEKFEYEQIRSSMTLENGIITASYPYKKNLSTLPNNYSLALKRLEQIERKLSNDPEMSQTYQKQFTDMINRGKMRILPPEEQEAWTGAVQYLPHNYVLDDTSASTPCRLIFDTSSRFKGHCINDYWGRGPNLIKDYLGILYRFCEFNVAISGDVKKMYHTVMTTPKEWHLHRVLWRNFETDRDPDTYIIICNSFGSGPAGTVAIAALHFLADLMKEEFQRAAKTITDQSYVDDILDSTSTSEEAHQLIQDVQSILAIGSFSIKKWIVVDIDSSPIPPVADREVDLNNESVLGMKYDTRTDYFSFFIRLNFNKKRRGTRPGRNLERDQIFDRSLLTTLTKRKVMSQCHTIYDPLGCLAPFIVELKFCLGKLWRYRTSEGHDLGWDDEIPEEHDIAWRKLFNIFFDIELIKIPRCMSKKTVTGNPTLIAFSDSSMIAFGCCLYIRWLLTDGNVFSKLVSAKSRMWPIDPTDYLSVCRGELQGVVLAERSVVHLLKESRFTFSEVLFVIDSEIVLAQINMDSHNLSVFVGPRVAELRSAFSPEHYFFTRSENNPCADLLSRGTQDVSLLAEGSTYQTGPSWLHLPRDKWPISQNTGSFSEPIPEVRLESLQRRTMKLTLNTTAPEHEHEPGIGDIPPKYAFVIQKLGESVQNISNLDDTVIDFSEPQCDVIEEMINLKRHDDLNFWLAVTYRILRAVSWKPGHGCFFRRTSEPRIISAEQRQFAKNFWIKQAQKTILKDIKSGKYKTLTLFKDTEGIYHCNARASTQPGAYQPIFLPHGHPLSRLIVIMFHKRGHHGATATAAKVRSEYHILKLRHLTKQVRNKCQLCRLVEKRMMKAPMGTLPIQRVLPSYPFEHSSCDIFGPYQVELFGKVTRQRQHNPGYYKAYGLILTCLSTRAIHIETMHGQSTNSFLSAFRRFICMRGQPKTMYSDCGGQLVAADEELKPVVDALDHNKIKQFGVTNGMQWSYASPGSPWQNGVSESLIASVKKTLNTVMDSNSKLPILELQTVFYEVAELLNERPINLGHQGASGDDYHAENTYVCPNELLLGRCSITVPDPTVDAKPTTNTDRLFVNQTIVTQFWKKWSELYLPTLVHQSKWYSYTRQAQVGDIVFVKDLNPIRGQYNIAEIVELRQNDVGVPINVYVRYRIPNTGLSYKSCPDRFQWRDIKNLALIVGADERVKSKLNPNATEFNPSS